MNFINKFLIVKFSICLLLSWPVAFFAMQQEKESVKNRLTMKIESGQFNEAQVPRQLMEEPLDGLPMDVVIENMKREDGLIKDSSKDSVLNFEQELVDGQKVEQILWRSQQVQSQDPEEVELEVARPVESAQEKQERILRERPIVRNLIDLQNRNVFCDELVEALGNCIQNKIILKDYLDEGEENPVNKFMVQKEKVVRQELDETTGEIINQELEVEIKKSLFNELILDTFKIIDEGYKSDITVLRTSNIGKVREFYKRFKSIVDWFIKNDFDLKLKDSNNFGAIEVLGLLKNNIMIIGRILDGKIKEGKVKFSNDLKKVKFLKKNGFEINKSSGFVMSKRAEDFWIKFLMESLFGRIFNTEVEQDRNSCKNPYARIQAIDNEFSNFYREFSRQPVNNFLGGALKLAFQGKLLVEKFIIDILKNKYKSENDYVNEYIDLCNMIGWHKRLGNLIDYIDLQMKKLMNCKCQTKEKLKSAFENGTFVDLEVVCDNQ